MKNIYKVYITELSECQFTGDKTAKGTCNTTKFKNSKQTIVFIPNESLNLNKGDQVEFKCPENGQGSQFVNITENDILSIERTAKSSLNRIFG